MAYLKYVETIKSFEYAHVINKSTKWKIHLSPTVRKTWIIKEQMKLNLEIIHVIKEAICMCQCILYICVFLFLFTADCIINTWHRQILWLLLCYNIGDAQLSTQIYCSVQMYSCIIIMIWLKINNSVIVWEMAGRRLRRKIRFFFYIFFKF